MMERKRDDVNTISEIANCVGLSGPLHDSCQFYTISKKLFATSGQPITTNIKPYFRFLTISFFLTSLPLR